MQVVIPERLVLSMRLGTADLDLVSPALMVSLAPSSLWGVPFSPRQGDNHTIVTTHSFARSSTRQHQPTSGTWNNPSLRDLVRFLEWQRRQPSSIYLFYTDSHEALVHIRDRDIPSSYFRLGHYRNNLPANDLRMVL